MILGHMDPTISLCQVRGAPLSSGWIRFEPLAKLLSERVTIFEKHLIASLSRRFQNDPETSVQTVDPNLPDFLLRSGADTGSYDILCLLLEV